MRTLRLLLTFYKSFAFASLVVTLSCVGIIYTWGFDTFSTIFWFKIATFGLIIYYIHNFKKDDFSYYKNLGLTKKLLWISTLLFDFLLFLILITITLQIR